MTENEVIASAQRYAKLKYPTDPDAQADVVSLAWYLWRECKTEGRRGAFSRFAYRDVRVGRHIPGTYTRKRRLQSRMVPLECLSREPAGKGERPLDIAAAREHWRLWLATLTEGEAVVALALADDYNRRAKSVAEAYEVSEGRVSQLRTSAREKWRAVVGG